MAENEEKNGGLMKLIIIAVSIVVVLSIIGFVMVRFINPASENSEVANDQVEQSRELGPTYQMGEFTVNFAEANNFQFLKASIVFEVSHDKLTEELNKRKPQLRDLIISVLRSQSPEDIKSPSTQGIKDEIKNVINNNLNTGEVKNVWFTQLVIQ
ncbi:MAG: flagellar basal body-associated FliL family protein [Bacillota bacterium]